VFTVVNALGTIVDRNGRVVRCERNDADGPCPLVTEKLAAFAPIGGSAKAKDGPTGNTTLTLVVTNQKLPYSALRRVAVQVHGSMNRAIQPFATEEDGDVLYAVTTDEVENASLSAMDLGVLASELAWDAVLSAVPPLPPTPRALDSRPDPEALAKFRGHYGFHGGGELTIGFDRGTLTAEFKGNGRMYFDADKPYRMTAAQDGLFVLESAAKDVVRFEESEGRITGLTVNPGPWAARATRLREPATPTNG
jgi:hypothetical protein